MNAFDPGRMVRTITRVVHAIDHRVGRIARPRKILVDLRTPVCKAILEPVYEALACQGHVSLSFTSEYPDRVRPLLGPRTFVTHAQAEWQRFDLYLNADPWAAARLRRCARRINFFHGVAGKYDLDAPAGLPMGLEYYDRVAFINRDRLVRYVSAGLVTADRACLVGYPKLDRLASGAIDGAAVRRTLGLASERPTVLYAPTYSPASSLHLAGESIVRALGDTGCNVVVKLHDRSLDADPRYTGGIDWRERMRALERGGQIVYAEGPDASPYLAAADAMVTDHSSVGFEFLVVDRPLVVFDAPDLPEVARINREKVALLRSTAVVAHDVAELTTAISAELRDPARLSARRRQVASEMFHDPGGATDRAVAVAKELLARQTPWTGVEPAVTQPARGGLS